MTYSYQAEFLIIAQFNFKTGMKFQTKISGVAGFNVNITATNPRMSASSTVQMMAASPSFASSNVGFGEKVSL